MKILFIALIIVLVLIVGYVFYYRMNMYTPYPNINLMTATVDVAGNSSTDGNVKFLGNYPTILGCQTACGDRLDCSGYTWHDNTTGSWGNMCYGINKIGKQTPDPGHFSGKKNSMWCPSFISYCK